MTSSVAEAACKAGCASGCGVCAETLTGSVDATAAGEVAAAEASCVAVSCGNSISRACIVSCCSAVASGKIALAELNGGTCGEDMLIVDSGKIALEAK